MIQLQKHRSINMRCIFTVLLVFLATGCGLLKHKEADHSEEGHSGEAHLHSEHRDTSELWDQELYPSSNNLYRMLGQIASITDTADHAMPSHAEMFIANFSDAYHPQQADSLLLRKLRAQPANWKVYVSADAVGSESRVFVPRLTRLLDQMRFDSASLFYRARSLNGSWINGAQFSLLPAEKVIPYANVFRQGKLVGTLTWEDRNRLAVKLLELLTASGN